MKNRIMIVDDALFMRHLIRSALESVGYEIVAEAENGADGLRLFEELRPDLITLDIIMPEMDGLQVLRGIRNIDQDAKVIMVTAVDQRSCMLKAMNLGISDFIVKPFEDARVISAVERALGSPNT